MIKIKRVIIKENKGIDLSEIKEKRHNFFIGISFSNKFFTQDNIKALICFCLENTKEKALVWIPGRMNATNYRYFDGMSRADALKKAFDDEENYKKMVSNILEELTEKEKNKIVIANYDDICTPKFMYQKELLFREFAEKGKFYEKIMEITNEIIVSRNRVPNKEKTESLALYSIQELPLFIDGAQKNGEDDIYTIIPYPGYGKLDDLVMDIIEGKEYPNLTSKLKITNKTGILDIGIEDEN